MKEKQNCPKHSRSGNAVPPSVISEKNNKTILTGTLTSRIETKHKNQETYYYGFFHLEGQEPEVPVIFKGGKPILEKGSQVKLTGQ